MLLKTFLLAFSILFLLILHPVDANKRNTGQGDPKYPSSSLQCFSTMTKPYLKLICPESRSQYCVKEVSTLTQNLCGATQYFGDLYLGGECILKKCASECVEETYPFEFEGQVYSRQRFCCKDQDYCNSSFSRYTLGSWVIIAATLLVWFNHRL